MLKEDDIKYEKNIVVCPSYGVDEFPQTEGSLSRKKKKTYGEAIKSRFVSDARTRKAFFKIAHV